MPTPTSSTTRGDTAGPLEAAPGRGSTPAPGPRTGGVEARPWVALRWGFVVAVVAAAIAVRTLGSERWLDDLSYHGVQVAAAAGAWWGASRVPRTERVIAWLMAAGITLSTLADVVWTVLDRVGADTEGSAADLAWAASYLALGAATWLVLRRHQAPGRTQVDVVVDVLTIVVVSLVLVWGTAVEGLLADVYETSLQRGVAVAYPIADVVLLALVVRAMVTRRSRARLGWFFAGGVVVWLVADVMYAALGNGGTGGDLKDAAWMVAPVLMACATWPSRGPQTPPAALVEPHVSIPQLVVAVGPLLVPPLLEAVADLQGRADRPVPLLVSMVVLVVLAFVRTGRLLGSERRAQFELERARDAAVEASEAKSVFLANMGHEIRTPLTSVLAVAEMLEDTPLDATQQQLLTRMQRNGELLRDLIERILDFSRISAGAVVLHPVEVDPVALVDDVVDAFQDRARGRGLALTSYADAAAPSTVVADPVRVVQVLTNLVDNAFKFTAEGSVALEVRPGEPGSDLLVLRVLDTGIGIRDEDQSLVFDLFKQVDGTMTRAYGGSGLGLAICRELATAMGGTVSVSSRPDEGSCFELRLPVAGPVASHQEGEAPRGTLEP